MHLPTLRERDTITLQACVVEDHGDDVVIAVRASHGGETQMFVKRSNILCITKSEPVTDRVSPL